MHMIQADDSTAHALRPLTCWITSRTLQQEGPGHRFGPDATIPRRVLAVFLIPLYACSTQVSGWNLQYDETRHDGMAWELMVWMTSEFGRNRGPCVALGAPPYSSRVARGTVEERFNSLAPVNN